MQVRHGLVHGNHHLLDAIHAGGFSARAVMVVKVGCHILADDCGILPIHEILDLIADKVLHLIQG
jgi:hypothetical protein